MSPRDTRTGGVLEAMMLPALKNGGYEYQPQVHVGSRIGGRKHMIDILAEKGGSKYLISLKWQQVGGTTEQKVPFEVICLTEAVLANPDFKKAYLVLGGAGWSLRDFYVSGGLEKFLEYKNKVELITLESFVAKANRGDL